VSRSLSSLFSKSSYVVTLAYPCLNGTERFDGKGDGKSEKGSETGIKKTYLKHSRGHRDRRRDRIRCSRR
jgi:hypothetical protein